MPRFLLSILLAAWSACVVGLIAFLEYTAQPSVLANFSSWISAHPRYIFYYSYGHAALMAIFGLGDAALGKAQKREAVRQRWLRRYAHRPVRQYPDIPTSAVG